MRNLGLESVRGLAAVAVLCTHLVVVPGLRSSIGSGAMFLNWGTEAVAIFFLLSGTVIRLSFDRSPRTASIYVWTRATRLLPLYWLAIAISIIVLFVVGQPFRPWIAAGHLLFLQSLQGFICPVYESNPPLWTISYEACFYLLFALTIGGWQQQLMRVWCLLAIGAIFSQYFCSLHGLLGHFQLILAYSSIWLLGYFVVDVTRSYNVSPLIAFASLGMVPMAARLPLGMDATFYLAARHLLVAFLMCPLFIFFVSRPAQTGSTKYAAVAAFFVLGITYACLVAALITTSKSLFTSQVIYIMAPFGTVLAGVIITIIIKINLAAHLLRAIAAHLGKLSYALYLLHFPIFYCASYLGAKGVTGAIVLAIVAFISAYFAETYFHARSMSLLSVLFGDTPRLKNKSAIQS